MSAPEPIDEFDRLLANEDSLEKYVSLGLALEELLEKLRAKGFEAEKETLSRLLELSPTRAQLLELAAERLLDSQKRQYEQAFLRDPHNLVQPFRSVLKENRDEVERLVQAALRTQAPGERSAATKLPDYPMVAANYAKTRSELGKAIGLGQKSKGRKRAAKKDYAT